MQTTVSVCLDEHIPKHRWFHDTQDDLTQKVSSADGLQSWSLEIPEKFRSTTIDENWGDVKAHTSLHRRQTIVTRYYLVDASGRISLRRSLAKICGLVVAPLGSPHHHPSTRLKPSQHIDGRICCSNFILVPKFGRRSFVLVVTEVKSCSMCTS